MAILIYFVGFHRPRYESDHSLRAADAPDPPHYSIQGDSISFSINATDNDVAVLDIHREVKTVEIGVNDCWDGPDPRTVPIKITNRGFAHLANCKKLQSLRLSTLHPLQVTDDGLKSIEDLGELRLIQFGITPFGSAGLSHLAGLTNLEELWLDFNSKYDDAAMDPISNLKKLRVLRFYTAPITDAGIAKIKGLTQLEDLQLGNSRVGDAAMQTIAGFVKLKTLDLQHTLVTNAGLEHLKPLTKLQWLCLNGTAVNGRGLASLSGMTEMKWLSLEGTQVDDDALDCLHEMAGLQSLYLSNTRITNVGVAKLSMFEKLTAVKLSNLPLTDDAIKSLTKMKSLKDLEMNDTKISPAALARLTASGVNLINLALSTSSVALTGRVQSKTIELSALKSDIEEQNNKVETPSIIKTEDQGYEEGKKEAEKDFKSGKYQLKKYGLCLPRKTYEQFLKNTYGVSTKVVAGCSVNTEIIGNAKGYNEVMKALLINRYKTDIFLEAEINETLEILENTRGKKFTDEEKGVAIKKIREAKEKEALNKEDASNPASPVVVELKYDLSAADFKLALVGKWKSVFTADKDNPNVQSLEFTADGNTDIVIAKADKTEQYSGTYTISFDREPRAGSVTMATITIRANGSSPVVLSRVNFGLHNGIPQQEGIVLRIDNEPYGVLKRQADRTDTADVKGTERPDGLLNITGTKTAPVHGEEIPEVVNLTGFASIGWVFSKSKEDLYDMWNQLSDNMKLKGSVVEFMDWPNVSRVIVIYNMWHLPGPPKDIRIQHIENNLKEAAFGDRFKGNNPGGTYIMLFQYDDSKRDVLLCFKDGVFIFESEKGIGAVDIRKNYKQGSANDILEAAPVIAVLKAAQDSDVTAFRDAYSKRIREGKEQADWENNLKEAQANMKKVFGDYQLKDFSFTFAGDKEKGKVTLSHKGKEAFPLNVIKEDDKWKVDER